MLAKILIGLLLTLIVVIFIPVYWAMESGRQEAARERQKVEAMTRGARLYSAQCAVCHGRAGEGKDGPALKGTRLDENALAKTITRGIAGTQMPAMGEADGGPLKEHQIKDLITFILNWNQSLLPSSPASAPTPRLPPTPTPTPTTPPSPPPPARDSGELYTARCAVCHGVKREGVSGLGPALTPESLAKLNDAVIKETILKGRTGTLMPPFRDALSPEEIDHLIQFIKYTPP